MRAALVLATGLFMLNAAGAHATPVSDASLNEVYRSCVASAPTSASPELRERFCGCLREEARRSFTQDTLASLEQRIRANATTMQDRDQLQGMQNACATRAREAPAASPVPPAPQSTPAPQPPQPAARPAPPAAPAHGTPLTTADLDAEQSECLSSLERSAGHVPAQTRQRFCGCAREWMQRTLTREALAGLNQRQQANAATMQDREQMGEVMRVCMAQAQQPASATPTRPPQLVSRPPAPPAALPAPIAHPGKKTPLR